MNSEADFVRMIADSPNDRDLPLIFADWLEEQGDPRAPWVRNPQVRAWMGPKFESPFPALVDSLSRKKQIMEIRRIVAAIGAPAIPALLPLLDHQDAQVRELTITCLRKLGKGAAEAVPRLLEALKDPSAKVRELAAKAIRDAGAKRVAQTDRLRDALGDQNESVRRKAAEILGAVGAKGAVLAELAAQLQAKDATVRRSAVVAIGALRTPQAVAPLCQALADADVSVREAAATCLGDKAGPGTAAVGPLRLALGDASATVREQATRALGRMGFFAREALPDLLTCLLDRTPAVRNMAAFALGNTATNVPEAREALLAATWDADKEVRRSAIGALSQWSQFPVEAAPALVRYFRADGGCQWVFTAMSRLERPTPEVLSLLCECLRGGRTVGQGYADLSDASRTVGAFGPAAAEAIPDLTRAVLEANNPYPALALARMGEEGIARLAELLPLVEGEERRVGVLTALCSAGPAAAVAFPHIRRCLSDVPPYSPRTYALRAIAAIGPPAAAALPDLLALLTERHNNQPAELFWALGQLLPALVPHIPQLLEVLRDPARAATRARIISLLRCLKSAAAAAVPDLLPLLADPDIEVRRETAEALGYIGAPEAVAGLRGALRDPDEHVRFLSATALSRLNSASAVAVPDFVRLLTDAASQVRWAAVSALAQVGVASLEALAGLEKAATDADKGVRTHATRALQQLRPPSPAKEKRVSAKRG